MKEARRALTQVAVACHVVVVLAGSKSRFNHDLPNVVGASKICQAGFPERLDIPSMLHGLAQNFNRCPLSSMPSQGFTAVFPGGQTRCLSADSPRYSFNVIPGDSDKLLLFFEGDGLCFNGVSGLLKTCAQSPDDRPMDPNAGVFRRSSSNPFRSHTVVFITYCSGDLFASNSMQDFGAQHGLVNAESAVNWAKANMANHLESLVMIGESAGGAAVQLWSRRLLQEFSHDRATVIVDSLIGFMFPTVVQSVLSKAFGICRSGLLAGTQETQCDNGDLKLIDVFSSVMDDNPDVLFAVINSKEDQKQIWMYNFMAPTLGADPAALTSMDFYQLVNTYLVKLGTRVNFVSYIVSSDDHGFTSKARMITTDTTGSTGGGLTGAVTLPAWLSSISRHAAQSQCSGPALVATQWSTMNLDYCDTSQVSKVFGIAVPLQVEAAGLKARPSTGPHASSWEAGLQTGRRCSIGMNEGCLMAAMTPGEVTVVYPGGQTGCLSSKSPRYGFNVIPGDPTKLLLYFEGGGLCFNGFSQFLHTCTRSIEEDPMDANAGVFTRSGTNPFKDFTVVFMNYCSGDMWLGRSDTRGSANAEATLKWAKANMAPHLMSFVAIGESAGGVAIQMWSRTILQQFSYSHASIIVDSMVTQTFPPMAQRLLAKKFDVCDSGLLIGEDMIKCADGKMNLDEVFQSVVDDHPSVLFAVINSKADMAQIWMYNFMAPMIGVKPGSLNPEAFFKIVNRYLDQFDGKPNFVSYLVNSDVHCFTSKEWMATTDTTGDKGSGSRGDLTLSAWLSNFTMPGTVPVLSQCSGAPLAASQAPPVGYDYCDSWQAQKVFAPFSLVGPMLKLSAVADGPSGGPSTMAESAAVTTPGVSGSMIGGLTGLSIALLGLAVCSIAGILFYRRKDGHTHTGLSAEADEFLDTDESDAELGIGMCDASEHGVVVE